jgi:hypothetical protein
MWTVGINNQNINRITVYPVPAKSQLHIEGQYDYLRIFDLLGKVVLCSTYLESINVNNLNDGMYLLEIGYSNEKYYKKIQVAK